MKRFPVLGCKKSTMVNIDKLDEGWAIRIHNQTLSQLASRGGLSAREIFLNINKMKLSEIKTITDDEVVACVESIKVINE